jgi:hypothetical protein
LEVLLAAKYGNPCRFSAQPESVTKWSVVFKMGDRNTATWPPASNTLPDLEALVAKGPESEETPLWVNEHLGMTDSR